MHCFIDLYKWHTQMSNILVTFIYMACIGMCMGECEMSVRTPTYVSAEIRLGELSNHAN